MSAVDAVLLDVGGVLILPDAEPLLATLGDAGMTDVTLDDLARGHYAGIAAMDRSALAGRPMPDWPAYHAGMTGVLGVEPDRLPGVTEAIGLEFRTLRWTRPIPGAVDALRRLAATGVAIAIVSNSNGTVEAELLAAGICQVGPGEGVPVAAVLDSGAVGIEKPDPRIFLAALEALGVSADRAVHVGDTKCADIAGAERAGVRPIHLDPHGFCPSPDGHEHVTDLDRVTALIG